MSTQTLTVTLATDVVYVEGTVNSVPVTWTKVGTSDWQATADRAADDIYRLNLTLINSLGTSTTTELTLYYGLLNLVTDRTSADVQKVARYIAKGWAGMSEDERAEWLAGMKGAYNYIDLNRVGAAVEYITTRLNAAGYSVKTAPKQGWTLGAIPTSAEMSGYLGDVRALRDAVFDALPGTTPELPSSMERLDWRGANAIEQVLLDVNAVIDRINARSVYAGEFFAGETNA